MKSVVHKHLIPFQEGFDMNFPVGSQVVRIAVDQGNPYMWVLKPVAEVGVDQKMATYHFKGSKTGGVFEHENDLVFVGTYAIFIQMELMLYVFLDKITDPESGAVLAKADEYVNNCWRC